MRNYLNSNEACVGQVQKYIGTSYEVVKRVADHIEELRPLFENLGSNELKELIHLAPQLKDLLDRLVSFKDGYYGPLDQTPQARPSGTPSQTGDMYYDTTRQVLMIYQNGEWVPVSGVDNDVEVVHVKAADISGADAVFKLQNTYDPGTGNLVVFVNGTFQYPITLVHTDGAYQETNPDTVTFPGAQLQVGDVVTFITGKLVTNVAQTVGVQTGYYRTIVTGERVISLPGDMFYNPGLNNLEVYVDGRLQIPGVDYTETDKGTVTFTQALPMASLVAFKKGSVIASGSPAAAPSASDFHILSTVGEFFTVKVPQNKLVVLRGHTTVKDGGFGIFAYDPLMPRVSANGGTVVDSTQNLANQGKGVGSGAWVRQYAGRIHAEWFGLDGLNMQELSSIQNPQHGDLAELKGYHTDGDGGEGEFYWDENRAAADHDGGMVIDPVQVFPANWNNPVQMTAWFTPRGTGTGAWVRLNQGSASVAWFGAKGDNASDNSRVFDGIASAVQRGQVRDLWVPAGEFVLSGTDSFEINSIKSRLKIYGDGEASTIRCKVGAAQFPFIFRNSNGIEIEGIRFTDERRTAGNNGLSFLNCSDVIVNRCYFDGISNRAISIEEDTIGGTSTACDNIRIESNQFVRCGPNNGNAIYHSPKVTSHNLNVINNYVYYCGATNSAAIHAGMATFGANIRNNYLDGSLGQAIRIEAYEDAVIADNMIEDFGTYGIFIHSGSVGTYNAPTLTSCRVTGNNISFINPTNPQGTYGIAVEGNLDAAGLLLIGSNTTYKCAGISIQPQLSLRNIVVSENKIQDIPATLFGLFVGNKNGGGTEGLYVRDNYIENEDFTKNAVMVSLTNAKDTSFERNHVKRSGTTDLSMTDCGFSHVVGNVFYEPNTSNNGTAPVVQINDTKAVDYTLAGNVALTGRRGNFNNWHNVTTAPPTVHVNNNVDIF